MTDARAGVEAAGRAAFPGFALRVLARTPSTQDVVRAAARSGAAAGWCCVAAEQTAGRGRQGREWVTPAGSALLMSVLLRPSAAVAGGVPLAAGLAVADAVAACGATGVGLKWPNDVLAPGGGKLAGVLAEVEPRGGEAGGDPAGALGGAAAPRATEIPAAAAAVPGGVSRAGEARVAVVLGVGLNLTVGHFPPGVAGASLHRLVGRRVGWEEALAGLLTALGGWMGELESVGPTAIVAAWRQRAVGLGAAVEAHTPQGVVRGTAVDVDDDGALLIDTGSGVQRVVAADVHLSPRP